jgi:hypothetical protein
MNRSQKMNTHWRVASESGQGMVLPMSFPVACSQSAVRKIKLSLRLRTDETQSQIKQPDWNW